MATIRLKKGYDLKLQGGVGSDAATVAVKGAAVAVIPDDFHGLVPRLEKREGDTVAAGDALFHDKTVEAIKVTSPVSGKIARVVRGDRRKILSIVIEPDGSGQKRKFDTGSGTLAMLLESGLWARLRQRPYDVVPDPAVKPRDIFVTCFDSAPLAPNLARVAGDNMKWLRQGVEALKGLTAGGHVDLGVRHGEQIDAGDAAVVNEFIGPHPAGNAGVQAANVRPVNKGETVWTLDVVTLAKIGRLVATGEADYSTLVAVTGTEVATPQYVATTEGCDMKSLLGGNLADSTADNKRIISGNPLTGSVVGIDGYLRAPYRQATVIEEVAQRDEFMGWASVSPKRFSIYRDFTSWLLGNRKPVALDARLKGGKRAIVMSGEYDRMLPMDIYAEFLIKAIIAFDIDKMEQLGIYEVAPEDFALAEYADTSKLELQQIVRDGLDRLRKEMC